MSKMTDEQNIRTLPPASLRPELEGRLLAAMQAASVCGEADDELELRLHRLTPSPLRAERERNILAAMQQDGTYVPASRWRSLYRWGAAAALFFLCTSAGLVFVNNSASANEPSGFACRSVVTSQAGEGVEWHGGQTAVRPYEIHYEDAFVFDGDEGSTITVRVPNSALLLLEAEVI